VENAIFGTGSAKMINRNPAVQAAEARARTSIAFTLKANVRAMTPENTAHKRYTDYADFC
jgi:hypothetical protein